MDSVIRVLLVDDFAIVRSGLRALIDSESDMTVVGEAGTAETAVTQTRQLQPDVVLMDLVLPDFDGLTAVKAIRREFPAIHILVLSNYVEKERVTAVMQAQVAGYLIKDAASHRIIGAIRDVTENKVVMHPVVAHILAQNQ